MQIYRKNTRNANDKTAPTLKLRLILPYRGSPIFAADAARVNYSAFASSAAGASAATGAST